MPNTDSPKPVPPKKVVTLNDVAIYAGVGRAAVSAVLNDTHNGTRVSPATRQRIQEAVTALDYHPNRVARALRHQTTNIIGFYSGEWSRHIRKPFFTEILSGLERGCALHQKDLLIHTSFQGRTIESIYTELLGGQIGGLILFTHEDDELKRRLANSRLPVVAIANPVVAMPSVVVDDVAGSYLLAQHLCQRGHQRILYLRNWRGLNLAERRRHAFQEAAQKENLLVSEAIDPSNREGYERILDDILALPAGKRPTAVVCWYDDAAQSLLATCLQRQIRVPQDLAIAGFDGISPALPPARHLTTIVAPWETVAQTAVTTLVHSLKNAAGEEENRLLRQEEQILPIQLFIGDTT